MNFYFIHRFYSVATIIPFDVYPAFLISKNSFPIAFSFANVPSVIKTSGSSLKVLFHHEFSLLFLAPFLRTQLLANTWELQLVRSSSHTGVGRHGPLVGHFLFSAVSTFPWTHLHVAAVRCETCGLEAATLPDALWSCFL